MPGIKYDLCPHFRPKTTKCARKRVHCCHEYGQGYRDCKLWLRAENRRLTRELREAKGA